MSVEGMMLTGAFAGALGVVGDRQPGRSVLRIWRRSRCCRWRCCRPLLSITLRANQIVTGIGINILVLGGTTLAYREIFGARSRAADPRPGALVPAAPRATSRSVGDAVFQQVWLLYAGLAIVVLLALVLRYTALGLAIHAAGAEPRARRQVGPFGPRVRYVACCSPASCRRWRVRSCRSATSTPSPRA